MKRKAEAQAKPGPATQTPKRSKIALTENEAKSRFRQGLFDTNVLKAYTEEYATSAPYKHAVIQELVDDKLLRSVRHEIRDNVSFTPKDTDIYKIHQSGDLANLDGLEDDALSKLPSLLALRDALYSQTFRDYVSHVTGCGPLSGRKTDMAINVYTPGCFLLCHDDVIGSRKVSYILYLTDPDTPWKPEWGGALRLYPVDEHPGDDGQVAKTPSPHFSKVIPPAWNQLSFFAVQPGESFHDVEEVYHPSDESGQELDGSGGRVRMAISGWFHIPQIGEDGYVEGAAAKLAEKSSRMQLKGNPDQFDEPQSRSAIIQNPSSSRSLVDFEFEDIDFLLKYLNPVYLTPDNMEAMAKQFDETSFLTLARFLNPKFASELKKYCLVEEEKQKKLDKQQLSPLESVQDGHSGSKSKGKNKEKNSSDPWQVARPPHKHRYLYLQPSGPDELRKAEEESPVTVLLDVLLQSRQFAHWLQTATGCSVESHDLQARRFRRGQDYALATGYEGKPRLEVNLGFTPTRGWGDPFEREDWEDEEEAANEEGEGGYDDDKHPELGGVEIYMAVDDEGEASNSANKGDEEDEAAVYRSGDDEGDGLLFHQEAAWNKLTIVLRDKGALRHVEYVSRRAPGSRWDVSGTYGVGETSLEMEGGDDDDDDEEDEEEEEWEEWHGFEDGSGDDSDGVGSAEEAELQEESKGKGKGKGKGKAVVQETKKGKGKGKDKNGGVREKSRAAGSSRS